MHTRVGWACEEEVVYRFVYPIFAVWAVWGIRSFDSVKNYVEQDVSCAELNEDASLVVAQLVDDVEEVIGWE